MEKHRSNDCADIILQILKQHHIKDGISELRMSRHELHGNTLELFKHDYARLYAGRTGTGLHTLSKCPLAEIYEYPIFSKLNNHGYNITTHNIPNSYIVKDNLVLKDYPSFYTYYTITEKTTKPIYDAYHNFVEMISKLI